MLFPNEGWETGDAGGWIFEGSVAIPHVSTNKPRSGLYSLRFYTPYASIRWGRARYALTGAQIEALKGLNVTFGIHIWCQLVFAGGPGSYMRIEIDDGVGHNWNQFTCHPYTTWRPITVSRSVHPSAVKVEFIIYWYKSGGGTIYHLYVDDMWSVPAEIPVIIPAAPVSAYIFELLR